MQDPLQYGQHGRRWRCCVVWRVRRSTLVSLADKLAPCTVAMEACCCAHHVGRLFAARDLAAWLGLVPRQMTTGDRPKLLGITKRGNTYLRMLFIHGARAALPGLAKTETPLGAWLRGLLARAHRNVAVVALAAKLAPIAGATLRRRARFVPGHGTVTA